MSPIAPCPQHPVPDKEIQTAVGPGTPTGGPHARCHARFKSGAAAKYNDHRLGFSYFAMGRIVQRANPDEAFRIFKAADKMFRQSTQTNLMRRIPPFSWHPIKSHMARANRRCNTCPHMDAAYEEEKRSTAVKLDVPTGRSLELTGRALKHALLGWTV